MMTRKQTRCGTRSREDKHPFPSKQSVEFLTEKLRLAQARVQALEAQVRELELELHTLRHQSSPQHRLPPQRQLPSSPLIQQPLGNTTFTFKVENPGQHDENTTDLKSPELQDLLRQVPKTQQDWSKRREDVQISEPEALIRTVLELVYYTKPRWTCSNTEVETRPTGMEILRVYQRFVTSLRRDCVRAEQISNFATLLLVSLCRVAREDGTPVDTVDELMNDLLPRKNRGVNTKTQAPYLRHLRTAVLWPIGQAARLRKKFGNRADEFFFLCGPSIRKYRTYWENQETKTFADKALLPSPPKEGEMFSDVSFSVPFLVKLIAGHLFSLDKINKALETDLCQKQFDASIFAFLRRTQSLVGIEYPPPKKQKTINSKCQNNARDATQDTTNLASFILNFENTFSHLEGSENPHSLGADTMMKCKQKGTVDPYAAHYSVHNPVVIDLDGSSPPTDPRPTRDHISGLQEIVMGEDQYGDEDSSSSRTCDDMDSRGTTPGTVESYEGETCDEVSRSGAGDQQRSFDTLVGPVQTEDQVPRHQQYRCSGGNSSLHSDVPSRGGTVPTGNNQLQSGTLEGGCEDGNPTTSSVYQETQNGRLDSTDSLRTSGGDSEPPPGKTSHDHYSVTKSGQWHVPDTPLSPHAIELQSQRRIQANSSHTISMDLLASVAADQEHIPTYDMSSEVNGQTHTEHEPFGPAGNPRAMLTMPITHQEALNPEEDLNMTGKACSPRHMDIGVLSAASYYDDFFTLDADPLSPSEGSSSPPLELSSSPDTS